MVEIAGWQVGLMTCYDLRFPELARLLVDAGAELLVLPAAWVAGPRKVDHWRTLVRARAIENTVYVAAAGQPGPRYSGHSLVVDPLDMVSMPPAIEVTVPPQVIFLVSAALTHAVAHWSMDSCSPSLALLVMIEGTAAADVVVNATDPNPSVAPARLSCTARSTVSPGTRFTAATSRPCAPCPASSILVSPAATASVASVLEVNEPNVPRPATAVAPATSATDATTRVTDLREEAVFEAMRGVLV